MSTHLDDYALTTPCPSCGAGPTYWCVTFRPSKLAPGRMASYLHSTRTEPFREAWLAGLHDGIESGLKGAAMELEHARNGYRWARDDTPRLPTPEVATWLTKRAIRRLS